MANTKDPKDNKKVIAIICGVVAVVAAAVVATVIIVNNNNNNNGTGTSTSRNPIVGKWKYYDETLGSIDFIYTFNDNGTGQYDLSGSIMNFTYAINGNKITITYETGPFETEFEINGDTLNIKDSLGDNTLYKKM